MLLLILIAVSFISPLLESKGIFKLIHELAETNFPPSPYNDLLYLREFDNFVLDISFILDTELVELINLSPMHVAIGSCCVVVRV